MSVTGHSGQMPASVPIRSAHCAWVTSNLPMKKLDRLISRTGDSSGAQELPCSAVHPLSKLPPSTNTISVPPDTITLSKTPPLSSLRLTLRRSILPVWFHRTTALPNSSVSNTRRSIPEPVFSGSVRVPPPAKTSKVSRYFSVRG